MYVHVLAFNVTFFPRQKFAMACGNLHFNNENCVKSYEYEHVHTVTTCVLTNQLFFERGVFMQNHLIASLSLGNEKVVLIPADYNAIHAFAVLRL